MAKKPIIGITGSFGTGKTTVASMFKDLGAKVIDADKIVHSLIDKKMRGKLAKIVFQRKEYLNRLCKVIHPFVVDKIRRLCKKYKNKLIVIDAPLLIEVGLHKEVDFVIVVKAKKDIQIKRAMKKTKLSRKEVLARINCQIPLREKISLADFVIDNSSTLSKTKNQVRKIFGRFKKTW